MRAFKVPAFLLVTLSLLGCNPAATEVMHTPLEQAPKGLNVLFGSAERERYVVHEAPLSAANTYTVNQWFREKLTEWSATKPLTQKAPTTLQITLRRIDTDLDALSDEGDYSWGSSPGMKGDYPRYVSMHKTVRLFLTATLQKAGAPPCTQELTARAKEHRALWVPPHPFHNAYDFKLTFQRAIDDAIRQLDGFNCAKR